MSLTQPASGKQKLMHLLRTMLVTGLAYVVNYGITLVLTPYITNTVGTEAYGFVSLAKQFVEYATIVTTALNTYATRYIGIACHKNDTEKANVYFSSVFWGDIILASCIFAVALAVILFLEFIISIPAALLADVKGLFLLAFLAFWVSTVFSVFGSAGYIRDRMDLKGAFKTLSYIADALVLFLCYVCFPSRILYVGLGTLAAALVIAGADWWMSRKYLPMLTAARKYFSFKAVKQLVMNGFWMSFNMVGDLLNNGLDLLVCNQMLTSLAMGQLAIAKTMHTIVKSLYLVVDQAFTPRLIKAYAEENKEALLDELKLSMKLSGMLANIAFAGFAALGLSYYRLWIPNEDIELIYRLTVVTILGSLSTGFVYPLYYIYALTLKQRLPCFVTIIGGLFNVAGMYALIKYAGMGVYAVAWTTVAVMTLINFVTNPLYMAHALHVPWHTFYPDILRCLLSCGVLTALFYGLASLYAPDRWLTLILCAAGYALLGAPIHLMIVTNRNQRKKLLAIIRRRG